MKIKVAFFDADSEYLERLSGAFRIKYSDKIESYCFSDEQLFRQALADSGWNVIVISEQKQLDSFTLPDNSVMAYLTSTQGLDRIRGIQAVFKYQKVDLLYQSILNLYAEIDSISVVRNGVHINKGCCIIGFAPVCGGAGASTLAAACARHFAREQYRTLYLNMEHLNSTDALFHGVGQFTMSNIIFELKMRISSMDRKDGGEKKSKLELKLESTVRQDSHGVYFFAPPDIALDMWELSGEEKAYLLKTLKESGEYDRIIVDTELYLTAGNADVFRQMDGCVLVHEGSAISQLKLQQTKMALEAKEEQEGGIIANPVLLQNKTAGKNGLSVGGMKLIGTVPFLNNKGMDDLLEQLETLELYDEILLTGAELEEVYV